MDSDNEEDRSKKKKDIVSICLYSAVTEAILIFSHLSDTDFGLSVSVMVCLSVTVTTLIETEISHQLLKVCSGIHTLKMVNPTDFCDLLTFPLPQLAG